MKYKIKAVLLTGTIWILSFFAMEMLYNKLQIHKRYFDNNGKCGEKSFIEVIRRFPWQKLKSVLENATNTNETNVAEVDELLTFLINGLVPWAVKEPLVKINSSCGPEITENDRIPECVLQRNKTFEGRRIGILIQLGFDVDTLEIHLNQLGDIVDQFFIIESTRTHFRALRKPLVWEQIRQQRRFKRFEHLVTHFILDDEEMLTGNKNTGLNVSWDREQTQERRRWEKFLSWNNHTEMFTGRDFLGFGDADEIPSRSVILKLKYCEIPADPVDIGIWFPFGNINQAYKTDWPVGKLKFSYGDPTFWRLETALAFRGGFTPFPGRQRGKSNSSLLGGMHMTHYGYLPYQLLKRITKSGAGSLILEFCNVILELLTPVGNSSELLYRMETLFSEVPEQLLHRIFPLDKLYQFKWEKLKELAILPWFYNCNRNRYPAWEWKHDHRLDSYL